MSNPATLDLTRIVDVAVYVSPLAAPRRGFNEGLIIGAAERFSPATRLKIYSESFDTEMIGDGFLTSDPEYKAVQAYFAQTAKGPAANYVWVGQSYSGAIKAANVHTDAKGTGYAVGDILTVVQGSAALGTVRVLTVDTGAVATIAIVTGGWKYTTGTELSTTGGTGTGAKIDITDVGEDAVDAVTACRIANYEWYGVYVCGAAKADHEACATYCETASPTTYYFGNTSDSDVLTAAAGSVGVYLTALSYKRWRIIYTTTQSGTYPLNVYAGAALMGLSMGLMTGLNNCAFTLNNTPLEGIATEPLDDTAVNNILAENLDVYLNFGNYYNIILQGTGGKAYYDETMFIDWFANSVQLNMMDLFYQSLKVPQTDEGASLEMQRAAEVCKQSVDMGFVAPGKWNGVKVMNLSPGDTLSKGYLVQAPAYADQLQADREARKSVPIYVALKLAGAVHSVVIGVYVNR